MKLLSHLTLLSTLVVLPMLIHSPLCAETKPGRLLNVPTDHATIQQAVDAANDGDTIQVAPGTYHGLIKIKGKNLILTSHFLTSNDAKDVALTILDGRSSGGKKGSIITLEKHDSPATQIIGFTIQNGDHAVINRGNIEVLHNHFTGNTDALSFEDSKGVARFNLFENDGDDGIDMDGSSEAIIEDNVIRNNKDDGIEIRLHKHTAPLLNIVIRRNVFEGNREDGLQLIDYPGKSARTILVERNLFVKNAMAAIGCMLDGNTKENYEGTDLLEPVAIINNTLIGNHYGITGGDNIVLLNNIIAGTAKTALKRIHGDSSAGPNLLWNNATDLEDCDLSPDVFVAVDPLLDQDHKPKAGSPGTDAGAASFKYNGEELVLPADSYFGSAPDFGAFEYKN